jgi:hypothetical protein
MNQKNYKMPREQETVYFHYYNMLLVRCISLPILPLKMMVSNISIMNAQYQKTSKVHGFMLTLLIQGLLKRLLYTLKLKKQNVLEH